MHNADSGGQKKNFAQLFPSTLKRIQENKRLTKNEMAYEIGNMEHCHVVAISWDLSPSHPARNFAVLQGMDVIPRCAYLQKQR
jgi:hypothetical protein